MRLVFGFLLVLTLAIASPVAAQQTPPTENADPVDTLIGESHRAMTFSDEGLSGEGADFLLDNAKAAQFLLIGESHGNVETPALTTELARALSPSGYSVLAIEVGPVSAMQMTRLATQPDGMAAFQEFQDRMPLTFPFFFWEEEVAMFLEAHKLGYEAWGLDQEFIASARYLLSELALLVSDTLPRTQVKDWQERAAEGYRQFSEYREESRGFLNEVRPKDLEEFGKNLPPQAELARKIVEELRQSAIVYQHYQAQRYYMNNYDRIRLMKRHLAEQIEQAGGLEATPKAIFKFGSMHMGRGYSSLYQLDLGNAAAELAAARKSDSFHLNVLTMASVGADGTRKDWTTGAPYLARFGKHLEGDTWGIFDLRPLRLHFSVKKNREADPALAELVFRYDTLVLAPLFHTATPMIELPF